jgi:hypothetical protein
MTKTTERWVLFEYRNLIPFFLSKPFKTKAAAEKARMEYLEKERRKIGVGVIRTEK